MAGWGRSGWDNWRGNRSGERWGDSGGGSSSGETFANRTDEVGQVAGSAASGSVQPRDIPSSGDDRPQPRRGDWVQARGERSRIVLKFYSAPPNPGGHEIDAIADVRPHQYIGPVHEVVDNGVFVSVCVPHPVTGWLAWMNIWSCTRGRGVHYARLVSDEKLASWRRQGWSNEYVDGSLVWLGLTPASHPADW